MNESTLKKAGIPQALIIIFINMLPMMAIITWTWSD